MAKTEKSRHFSFYVLNVKLRKKNSKEDLKPEDYTRILKRVYRHKVHKESSPNKHCIFRFMFEEKEDGEVKYLSGTFAQFTFIQNERWFNLESLDLDQEFRVPDGLFPDAKITDFVFVPAAHRFVYKITGDFAASPYTIKKFLENAIDQVCDSNTFVQVDVESDISTIETILSAREIKKVLIDINYSNVDIGSDLKKFVEDDIKASNTSRLKIEATQKPDTSIDIHQSKILTGAIEASISNGETEAVILDEDNRTQRIKTSDFPLKDSVFGVASRFNELVYQKVINRFRRNGNQTNKRQS